MSYKQKKIIARSLFIKSDLLKKDLALRVGVSEKTLRKWIEEGDWENIKESETISRANLLQDAYRQLKAINSKIKEEFNGIPNKELSDAKGVIRKEIEALSDTPIHQYIEMSMEFTRWIQNNEPKKLLEVTNMLDGFINEIASKQIN